MRPDLDLSPKGVGALLDDALALYRAQPAALATAAAIVVLPAALVVNVARVFYVRGALNFIAILARSGPNEIPSTLVPAQTAEAIATGILPLLTLARWFLLAGVVAVGPLLLYGHRVQPRRITRPGWHAFLSFVGAELLVYLAAGAAFVLTSLTIVGIAIAPFLALWLFVRFALAGVVVVAEGCKPTDGMRRAWRLTRGRWWRTFGFLLSVGLVMFGVASAIESPGILQQIVAGIENAAGSIQVPQVGWIVLDGVLVAIATAVGVPFTALCWYRYYLDLRSRSEGMDLLVRATDLAEDARP